MAPGDEVGSGTELSEAHRAIGANEFEFAPVLTFSPERGPLAKKFFLADRRNEVVKRVILERVFRDPEKRESRRVRLDDAAIVVEDDDSVQRAVEERTE